MLNVIINFISNLITICITIYLASKITNSKNLRLNPKTLIILLVGAFLAYINYNYAIGIEKMIGSFLIIGITCKVLLDLSWSKTSITSFFIFLIYVVAEISIMPLWINITNLSTSQAEINIFLQLLTNIIINSFVFILISIKPITNKLIKLVNWSNNKKIKPLSIIILLLILVISFNMVENGLAEYLSKTYLYNTFIIMSAITIAIFIINENSKSEELILEYDRLLEYVKTFEEWIEKDRKKHHEDKNQLIVLKGMVNNNKKLDEYISEILKEPEVVEEYWLNKLKYIPAGGLKGLIYYKIVEMKNAGLHVSLNVSTDIKELNLGSIPLTTYKDIFRSLGVFLDNAKEASMDSAEELIGIELYKEDDKLYFTISNTFDKNIDIEQIGQEKYSTKGKGRGYGLSLVNDILKKNKNIKQEKSIINNLYIQHLIVKVK